MRVIRANVGGHNVPIKVCETPEDHKQLEGAIGFKVSALPVPGIDGSKQIACLGCGEMVWFSPATAASIEAFNMKPTCMDCMILTLQKGKQS